MAKTYPRVVELIKDDLKSGETLRGVVRKTRLNSNTIANYLEGITEPTQASLTKIAMAYGKPIAWLRGDTDSLSGKPPIVITSGLIDLTALTPEKRALWDAVDKLSPKAAKKVLDLLDMIESGD